MPPRPLRPPPSAADADRVLSCYEPCPLQGPHPHHLPPTHLVLPLLTLLLPLCPAPALQSTALVVAAIEAAERAEFDPQQHLPPKGDWDTESVLEEAAKVRP